MLPRENRLKQDKDFKALFSQRSGVYDSICGLKYKKNGLPVSRAAVVVGTKVSKSAVVRNRLRRQIREALRLRFASVLPGYDMAWLVRPDARGKTYPELAKVVDNVLKKAKLLK